MTNAEAPEQEPALSEKAIDAVYIARDTVADSVRYAIAGDKHARIRRGVLYLATGFALLMDVPLLGISSVLLLALTDAVVEAYE